MLTPVEIERKVLKSGFGYDKKEVDHFIDEILESYEAIYKENVALNDKISVLSDGVQYYKGIEKTLQKALVLAERTADETKAAAQAEAETILYAAQIEAEKMKADAKRDLEALHARTLELLHQYDIYKAQFHQLAAAQLEILESEAFQLQLADFSALLKPSSASLQEDTVSAGLIPEDEDE